MRRALFIASICSLAGCQDEIPSEPTWFGDVQPLIEANCARCHGADPYDPKVAGFRLDRYVRDDAQTLDAFDYRDQIVAQAVDLESPAMPLDYRLSERQREILRRWVDAGAPKGDRDNALPSATAVEPADGPVTVDQSLALTFRAWDDDGDGLTVAIGARERGQTGGTELFAGLGGGLRSVEVDTGQLASGRTFEIYAVVDDGFADDPAANQHDLVLLGDVTVDHGDRGTAPTVVLVRPNGGATLIGTTTIAWSASDPDAGDTLTIDLDLIRVENSGDETVVASIASGLANDPPSFDWDTSTVPAEEGGVPIQYKVRVTATDAGARNSRSDSSDQPFTIAAESGSTDLTWDDVRSTFETYCSKCHSEPARTPALDYFRLDRYDAADADGDLGVYEMRSQVYQRLVVAGTMPPAVEPQPPAAAVDDIADWILGGAPRGGDTGDAAPLFDWTTPNDAAISQTDGSGAITLRWAASDPEGTALTGAISVAQLNATVDALAFCDSGVTGWTDLAGADVTAGSFAFVAPSEGYFCFRGQVTDGAGQTTTAIAARPVKYKTIGPGPP